MIAFVIASFAIAFLGLGGVRAAQVGYERRQRQAELRREEQRRAQAARQTEIERVQTESARRQAAIIADPADVIYTRGVALNAELEESHARREIGQRTLDTAKRYRLTIPEDEHQGLALYVRLASFAVLPLVFAGGVALAVSVFVALNNGRIGVAPILKGVVAGSLEVLLALGFARLIHHRRVRELRWQFELATLLPLILTVVVFLAIYSPQRSQQTFNTSIDDDRRVLAAAQQSGQKLAVTAAQDKLTADLSREHRAEESDSALAVGIPLVEVVSAEMALEGLSALQLRRRRRLADASIDASQGAVDQLDTKIRVTRAQRGQAVADELYGLGVRNLPRHMDPSRPPIPPAHEGGPGPAVPNTPAAPLPRNPEPRRGGGIGLDLDGFARPQPPPGGDDPRWNLT